MDDFALFDESNGDIYGMRMPMMDEEESVYHK